MVSQVIIRSDLKQRIGIRQLLLLHGELLNISECHFGLSNARATFQRAMDYAFRGLIGKLIEIYQDDLTVFSKDGKTHIDHLRQVLDRCREFGISLNPAKSVFGVIEGKLLGHIITKDGVKLDLERVEAIGKVPLPNPS
jgi:hypothetical protein